MSLFCFALPHLVVCTDRAPRTSRAPDTFRTRLLRKVGEITITPAMRCPTVREHAPRLLSAEAQRNVLDAIPEPSRGIFLALALLGLRPSEAARLRAADYAAGDPGWLTIRVTKNRQVKRLPVPDELADRIARHGPREARLKSAPLFALPYRGRGRRPASPWSKTIMRRVWKAACVATCVEISLYEGTKHSRATDLLRQGGSERALQARCSPTATPARLGATRGSLTSAGGRSSASI